jgi:hypothetical protein
MKKEKLTDLEYWQINESNVIFKRQSIGHGIDVFIQKYIPITTIGSAIEIGSYPGPHLATLGDLGYELNGIDFCPDNAIRLPMWLKKEGFTIGEFWVNDFFEFNCERKFDVVCSFGFIEHFLNYDEVITKHANLVNQGGYLLLTTPNFRGKVQQFLHRYFDKGNLAVHNLDSMQPDIWAKQLTVAGFEILYKGHFGGFWFWRGDENLSFTKRIIIGIIERLIPRLRKLVSADSESTSAYCGIVARKL